MVQALTTALFIVALVYQGDRIERLEQQNEKQQQHLSWLNDWADTLMRRLATLEKRP
jgi:hypothetical protein